MCTTASIIAARRAAARTWRGVLLTLGLLAEPAAAQPGTAVVAGSVRDTAGRALEGAEVRWGERLATLTDAQGAFVLRGVPAASGGDTVRIAVRRIGYERRELRVAISVGTQSTVDVRLVPTVVALRTVVVEGRAVDAALHDVGWYRRERQSRGAFFDADELRHFGGAGLGSLLRQVPRVMVERVNNEEFAYSPIAGTRCRMNVFVDGRFAQAAMPGAHSDRGLSLADVVPRDEIHAVEVYPTFTSVPAEFTRIGPATGGGDRTRAQIPSPANMAGHRTNRPQHEAEEASNDAACGAIVIWTKTFTARR